MAKLALMTYKAPAISPFELAFVVELGLKSKF
jgi:hypothetical protein